MYYTLIIIGLAYCIYFTSHLKKRFWAKKVSADEKLTVSELITVIILNLINPILFGLIFYFTWKGMFPKKSKQADTIAMIILVIEIIIGFAFHLIK